MKLTVGEHKIVENMQKGKKMKIGTLRRALMIRGTWKWNAWVRDITARMEMRGWLHQ